MLILSMALPRANRTPGALLILVPLAAVYLGWLAFREAMGGNEPGMIVFGVMIYTLAVGSATLWLLAHRYAARAWYKTLLAAIGITLGVTFIGGLSLGMESNEMVAAIMFIGMMMVAMVVGYALAAWGYGTRRAWRFLVLQAAGTIGASFVGVLLLLLILTLILDNGPDSFAEFLIAVVTIGLMAGLFVFLIALPFAILGLSSPFFRQRLLMCLAQPPASSCSERGDSASILAET